MMDYPTWKKKTKTPQFIAFLKACQIDAALKETSATAASSSSSIICSTNSPVVSSVVRSSAVVDAVGQQQQHQVPSNHQQRGTAGNVTTGLNANRTSTTTTFAGAAVAGAATAQRGGGTTGTEIKIPGVGATPIAVSTTLPAAVVQLSQKGKSAETPNDDCFSKLRTVVHTAYRIFHFRILGFWFRFVYTDY